MKTVRVPEAWIQTVTESNNRLTARIREQDKQIEYQAGLIANYEKLTATLVGARDSAYETIAELKAKLSMSFCIGEDGIAQLREHIEGHFGAKEEGTT
jgi:hypothetical protein